MNEILFTGALAVSLDREVQMWNLIKHRNPCWGHDEY